MSKQNIGCFFLALVALCIVGLLIYQIPPINDRLAWRVEALQAQIKYAINPPEQAVFQPQEPPGEPLPAIDLPTASPTDIPTPSATIPGPTPTPEPTSTPTPIPTPIPAQAMLTGITHMYQMWNNCGPANLAMALTYWGWKGDQRDTAAYLKPNKRDKNVMPYEMASYVEDETELSAAVRVGGDLQILKDFVAAGFPVVVEKSFEGPRFDGWMGHYEVVNGYDDIEGVFYVQDSYDGPDLKIQYDKMLEQWRAFNHTFIVIYPPEHQAEVFSILGPDADPTANYQNALQKAVDEANNLSGRDLFFTWFNRGSNLVNLKDYQAAATAFDAAFANYPSIPDELRPWRMMWYNTYPYWAYYYTGRYQDVIDLADTTLNTSSERILEESFYWRGMAKLALADTEGAIADFKKAVEVHPGFIPAIEQLQALGINP